MNRHLEWIRGFLRFTGMIAGLLMVLIILNWLPGAVDREGMREYPGVEDLIREAGFESLIVPAYFPDDIRWPPRSVLGQKRPFMAAVIEFDGDNSERSLVISESESEHFAPGSSSAFSELRQSVEMDLRGRTALVETGLCSDGSACSRVSWSENGMHVMLFMRAPSLTLIRIAESMIR